MRIKILIAILLCTVVGVNYWNNTRPSTEYIAIPYSYNVDEVTQEVANIIEHNCNTNGYFIVNGNTYMCVAMGN